MEALDGLLCMRTAWPHGRAHSACSMRCHTAFSSCSSTAHIVITYALNLPFRHPPFLVDLSSFHWSWMAGGAVRQPLWMASASSVRHWQPVTAPSIQLGGHSQQPACRPPTRGPPPPRDARASFLLDFDTASGLHACTILFRAGSIFFQHGTKMRILDPCLGSRLSSI